MGQRNFKKPFEFHNFSEIFYCGMTRLRNTNLNVSFTISIYKNQFKKQKYGTVSLRNIQNFNNSLE